MTFIPGPILTAPIPPYQNVPIHPENYKPRRFDISDIILDRTTLVTTSVNHDYKIGQLCRLLIPQAYGCYELNERKGFVIEIPADNQVVLDIDSSQNIDPFVMASNRQNPQILAIGDVNTGAQNPRPTNTITYIPGSFINIS